MGQRGAALLCIVAATAVATVALASDVENDDSGPAMPREAARPLALRPLMPAGARTLHDRSHSVRVTVPPGWHHSAESLTPGLAPGGSILAVATSRARAEPRRACGHWPDMPQVAIGPRAALLHVGEELDAQPGSKPPRPRRLRLWEQLRLPGLNEPVASVFPWRCLNRGGSSASASRFVRMGDGFTSPPSPASAPPGDGAASCSVSARASASARRHRFPCASSPHLGTRRPASGSSSSPPTAAAGAGAASAGTGPPCTALTGLPASSRTTRGSRTVVPARACGLCSTRVGRRGVAGAWGASVA
jgi:hypothetical protein